jgi:hypothetical protein
MVNFDKRHVVSFPVDGRDVTIATDNVDDVLNSRFFQASMAAQRVQVPPQQSAYVLPPALPPQPAPVQQIVQPPQPQVPDYGDDIRALNEQVDGIKGKMNKIIAAVNQLQDIFEEMRKEQQEPQPTIEVQEPPSMAPPAQMTLQQDFMDIDMRSMKPDIWARLTEQQKTQWRAKHFPKK